MKSALFIAIFLLSIAILANPSLSQYSAISELSDNGKVDSNIKLRATSFDAKGENEPTNVTVRKYIDSENENFKFHYEITTPKVDEYYFVLALDSSGSFGYNSGENPARQAWAVIGAVPDFINDTIKNHPNKNFKLSIVSWDNDIDFAYTKSDFKNNDTSKVKLVSIGDVVSDIKKFSPFVEPDREGIPYRCEERDFTNLSVPFKASLDILNADINQPDDSHRVMKFVILVTGEGEHIRYNPELINNSKNIPIYVVGMEFKGNTSLQNHLKNDVCSDPNNFKPTFPNSDKLRDDLLKALNSALEKALSDPVATNVSIIEPIDRFFIPSENATVVIKRDSTRKTPIIGIKNNTSIEFQFPDGLSPENVTELSFDATFVLNLPISEIEEAFPSRLMYTWFNNKDFNITIPKNEIRIQSMPPTTPTKEKVVTEGFGILQLFASIIIWRFFLVKRIKKIY